MPSLDVTIVITDPLLQQAFVINRTVLTIDAVTGRNSYATTQINAYGVITEGAFDPLERTPQYEVSKDTIKITTLTPIYMVNKITDSLGNVFHYTPDVVLWKTNLYTAIKVWDYSTYGRGFYIATFEIADSEGSQ